MRTPRSLRGHPSRWRGGNAAPPRSSVRSWKTFVFSLVCPFSDAGGTSALRLRIRRHPTFPCPRSGFHVFQCRHPSRHCPPAGRTSNLSLVTRHGAAFAPPSKRFTSLSKSETIFCVRLNWSYSVHARLAVIGTPENDFRRRLPGDGVMELVLDHRVEIPRHGGMPVVVDGAFGEDVRDLLPNPALARPDRPDALQQFPEVVLPEGIAALFQALVVQCKPLDDVFPQTPVAQMRNRVAWKELTRYPTAMMASRL